MTHWDIVAALNRVRPGQKWALSGDTLDGLEWLDVTPKPSASELGL